MKNLLLVLLTATFSFMLITSCSEDDQLETSAINDEQVEPLQTNIKRCGHDHHQKKLLEDSDYKEAFEKRLQKFKKYSSTHLESRAVCSSPVEIPVAVHYQGVNSPNTACLIALANESIAVLNADFQGTNSDITDWTNGSSSAFPGVSNGEACLQFTIADINHPSGYGLTNGDPAVTVNQTNGDFVSAWAGYLNIYVNDADGALGYSPLGGSGNGDGVVIARNAFGSGSSCSNVGAQAPYNLGRTLTHEVGHYLLLDHIWGNGCGTDDGISDTPSQSSDYSGCPNVGASSCGSTDMHMNYMDYTNDACMYMFSAGQATVTENYVNSNLNNLTSNASNVISGGGNGGGNGTNNCASPTTVTAQVLSATSATVSWTAMPQAIRYQLQYRPTGTSSFMSSVTTSNSSTLNNLTAATSYDYRVRTECSTGWTAYTAIQTFTTQSNGGGSSSCDKPGFTSVQILSSNKAKVTWEDMPGATRYRIFYRRQGTSTWIKRSTINPERTLSNLVTNASYEYKIRSRCPSGWTAFTSIETFDLGSGNNGGGGSCSDNTLTFQLTLDNYGSETTWELIDASTGQAVATGGPYSDNQAGTVKTEVFCIPDGCYTLYVDDAYGDGICCAYGNGSFELLDINGAQVGFSNGQFGYYDYIDFCVTGNVASFKDQQRDQESPNLARKVKNSPSN